MGRRSRERRPFEFTDHDYKVLRKLLHHSLRKCEFVEALVADDLIILARLKLKGLPFAVASLAPDLLVPLTQREAQVAPLVGKNLGNRGIAARLYLSESRVAKIIEQIKRKWKVRSRAALARRALLFSLFGQE